MCSSCTKEMNPDSSNEWLDNFAKTMSLVSLLSIFYFFQNIIEMLFLLGSVVLVGSLVYSGCLLPRDRGVRNCFYGLIALCVMIGILCFTRLAFRYERGLRSAEMYGT